MLDNFAINNVQWLWALIFLILAYDIRKTWQTQIQNNWNVPQKNAEDIVTTNFNSLAQLHSSLRSQNKKELAEALMMELCRDAGIFFNTTLFYFLHLRKNPEELETYFSDRELQSFIISPDIWVKAYIKRHHGVFSWKKQAEIDPPFIEELERILSIFRSQLLEKEKLIL